MSRWLIHPGPSARAPLLEVDDLRTAFETPRGTLVAVDGVSLGLEAGHTLGVVGESGSGKTVLACSILPARLGPQRRHQRQRAARRGGELVLVGQGHAQRGVEAAIVFQDPMTSLNATMRIGDQITESLRYHLDMSHNEARTMAAVALLRSVGIPEPESRLRAYPHQLSGGMPAGHDRHRPGLRAPPAGGRRAHHRARRHHPEADPRPAGGPEAGAGDGHDLITHDLGVVAGRTDRIAVMYAGRVVERGPTRVLFHNRRHPTPRGCCGRSPA